MSNFRDSTIAESILSYFVYCLRGRSIPKHLRQLLPSVKVSKSI